MEIDKDRIDDMVLALLHLTSFEYGGGVRAWKGHDWAALDRLFEKGMISNPRSKAKSVSLTDTGSERARQLFQQFFREDR